MPIERFYLPEPFYSFEKKILKGLEFHHLFRVMRAREGDQVELINGRGDLAEAIIQEIANKQAQLIIENVQHQESPPVKVILAQAFPKLNRLDFIIEKGTELGVTEFWLFPGKLSNKKDVSDNQIERIRAQIIAAMKQCGRLHEPQVKFLPHLEKWAAIEGTAFFGDVELDAPLFSKTWESIAKKSSILFFVGPESGFTGEEITLLKSKGVHGVKLHDYILRTDTASLAALSLIHHWLLKS